MSKQVTEWFDQPQLKVLAVLTETRRKPTALVEVTVGPMTTTFEVVLRRLGCLALRAPHGAGGVPAASVSKELSEEIMGAARPHLKRL